MQNVGHLIRYDNFIINIIDGKIEWKRGSGRPRHSYMDQIKDKVAARKRLLKVRAR